MSFTAIWMEPAVAAYRRLRVEDEPGAAAVGYAIRRLAEDPWPPNSRQHGTSGFHRLRIGAYRVIYEVDKLASTILVLAIVRVSGGQPSD